MPKKDKKKKAKQSKLRSIKKNRNSNAGNKKHRLIALPPLPPLSTARLQRSAKQVPDSKECSEKYSEQPVAKKGGSLKKDETKPAKTKDTKDTKDSQFYLLLLALVGIIALLLIFNSLSSLKKTGMAYAPSAEPAPAPADKVRISFEVGENLVSFPIAEERSVNDVFAGIKSSVITVKEYTPAGWKEWRLSADAAKTSENTLNTIKPGKAYWVIMIKPASIELPLLDSSASKELSLSPGWNYVGIISSQPVSVKSALGKIDSSKVSIWAMAHGRITKVFVANPDSTFLEPGKGYMMFYNKE